MYEDTIKRFQELHKELYSHPSKVGKTEYWANLAMEGRFTADTPIPEDLPTENDLELLSKEDLTKQ